MIVSSCCAEAGIFQKNRDNNTTINVLAAQGVNTSAAMVVNVLGKWVLIISITRAN